MKPYFSSVIFNPANEFHWLASMGIEQTWDVIVVGSGPAGAMAAYELAKVGLKVAILEK